MKEKPKKKKALGRIITILVLLAGLLALLLTYSHEIKEAVPRLMKKAPSEAPVEDQEEGLELPDIVPVVAKRVTREYFEDILPSLGTIKGQTEVELKFEINGIIDSINFKEGDIIKKGSVVATLKQKDALLKLEFAQSKLKTAKARSLTAKKKLEIHQNLYNIGAIIKAKLEEVEFEHKVAETEVVSAKKEVGFARADLEKTYLLSPLDGIMGTRDSEEGEFITSQDKIATIIDIEQVFVEVGVIEKELQKIALGHEAVIEVDAYPQIEFSGVIEKVLPVIEGKTRTLTCKIKVDNADARLLPGMFARADIFVFGQEDAIVISQTALFDQDDDGIFESVYMVTPENTAQLRAIEIGYLTSEEAVINAGLDEGDIIIIEARGELADGKPIDILEQQEPMQGQGDVYEEEQEMF